MKAEQLESPHPHSLIPYPCCKLCSGFFGENLMCYVEIALYYMLENIQSVNLFLIELKYIADDNLCN